MDLSSGTKSLMAQAMSWAVVSLLAVTILLNYDVLKSTFGPAADPAKPLSSAKTTAAAPQPTRSDSSVELKAEAGGHYHARADINGRPVSVMVDTGASMVVLTYDDARRAGIYLKRTDFTQAVSTANGVTYVAPVTLERVGIGGITVYSVPAAVADEGRLTVSLLGMSFLKRLQRVDMRDGVLVLKD